MTLVVYVRRFTYASKGMYTLTHLHAGDNDCDHNDEVKCISFRLEKLSFPTDLISSKNIEKTLIVNVQRDIYNINIVYNFVKSYILFSFFFCFSLKISCSAPFFYFLEEKFHFL